MSARHALSAALAAIGLGPSAVQAQDLPVLGRVIPVRETVISAPRAGQLTELRFDEADRVARGEPIARFACEIEHAQKAAALAASQSLELQYRSQQQLRNFASTTALEVEIALVEWQRSLREVDIYSAVLDQCAVTAPFDGVVSVISVRNHEYLNAGEDIIRIIDDSQKFFEFLAPTSWLAGAPLGQEVRISLDVLGVEITGRIDRVAPEVDAVSQTVKMRAMVKDESNTVLVGMPGTVRRLDEEPAR